MNKILSGQKKIKILRIVPYKILVDFNLNEFMLEPQVTIIAKNEVLISSFIAKTKHCGS